MKKSCTLIFLILTLLFTGCSSNVEEVKVDSRISNELESHNWEYSSPETTYESTCDSDYWNYLDDKYEKMYYEAAVNANFADDIQKYIYLFYGDEVNDYSYISVIKAIQFARLDHPELELMNMDFRDGCQGTIYQSLTYFSREYDEYETKLNEVNSEIKDLVDAVNNTEDIIEKHRLIFKWITSNVKYVKSEEAVGNVDFHDEEFLLARLATHSTQNIYGAIVKKEAVCDGIADAYKYICNQCQLECIIVDGYISDISEKMYHAWNLVKVYDTWYLVDATWDLDEDFADYFMVKDLTKGERTPFNMGYTLPVDGDSSNQITFVETTETRATTDNGIVFDLSDENYSMSVFDDTIYTCFSSLGMERYLEKEEFSKDIFIQTNAEITKIEYFDFKRSLLKFVEQKENDSSIIFPENVDGTYVESMNVYLFFNGNTCKVKLGRYGA